MDDNWRLVLVAIAAAIPGSIAAWHTVHARKEMNGLKTELVQAVQGQAKAEGINEGKDTEVARQDALRGSSEDRKVP